MTLDSTPSIDPGPERALLGSMLLRADTIPLALDLVTTTDYALPRHAAIHQAITDLQTAGNDINPATVVAELDRTGQLPALGGYQQVSRELIELISAVPHSDTVAHAETVARAANRRRLHVTLAAALHAARQGDDTKARTLAGEATDLTGPVDWIPWENVAAVMRGEVDPIEPAILTRTDGQALMYPGLTHWLSGEPGKGKTWVALTATAEQLHAGRAVMYLDKEGNRRIVGDRLRALGVPDHVVDGGLLYWRPPALTPQITRALVRAATDTSTALVVIDGVAKAISHQGLSEDKAPDVLAWLDMLPNPLADTGAAVLLLDHVVKEKEGRGLWARGSGAKIGEVTGAAWTLKTIEAFSRKQPGVANLVQAKDREGHVGTDGDTVARIRFVPTTDGHLRITLEPPTDAQHGPDGQFRPTGLMEAVSTAVERLNAAGIRPSQNEITKHVPGKFQWKVAAITALIDEGHLTLERGPRGARQHVTGPNGVYRQADDPRSDKYQAPDDDPAADLEDPTDEPF